MLFAGDAVEEFDILSAVNRTPNPLPQNLIFHGLRLKWLLLSARPCGPPITSRFYAERFHTIEVGLDFLLMSDTVRLKIGISPIA